MDILACNNTILYRNLTISAGSSAEFCLPDLDNEPGFVVYVAGGSFAHEVGWSIFRNNASVVSGAAPFVGQYNCSSESSSIVSLHRS